MIDIYRQLLSFIFHPIVFAGGYETVHMQMRHVLLVLLGECMDACGYAFVRRNVGDLISDGVH